MENEKLFEYCSHKFTRDNADICDSCGWHSFTMNDYESQFIVYEL